MITNKRGIDSCKILIPIEKLTFDNRLVKTVYEIYSDFDEYGEIIKEHDNKPLTLEDKGFNTYYGFMNLFGKKFIYILVNSKMLKTRYFEAINIDTIQIIYNHIKSQKIVDITFDNFLNANVTDIDIKTDFRMNDEAFYRYCKDRKDSLFYPKFYSSRPNLGIEYVKRSTASPSNPYVKYYSKSAELFGRSLKFKELYFPHFHDEILRRCEVTVKNHDHKKYISKYLFELPKTLGEWVNLTQEQYKLIIQFCVNQHEKGARIPKDRIQYNRTINALTSRDYFVYKIYQEFKRLGYEDKHIINLYTQRDNKKDTTHTTEKSRISSLIRKLREVTKQTINMPLPF